MTGADGGPGPAPGPDGGQQECGGHPGLAAELRALTLTALDRLEPAVARIREAAAGTGGTGSGAGCTGCPICALLAVLRGERPELAGRLAEQLVGLLAVLRTALQEGDPAGATPPDPDPLPDPGRPGRRVQRIPVERVGT